MLHLLCTSCKQRFGVLEEVVGESVTCPYCAQKMKAPEPVAMLADALSEQQPRARAVHVERHRPEFWTTGRTLGLLPILLAIVLVVAAFTIEYEPRYGSSVPKLTSQGEELLIGAAVCAGIGTFLMFVAGPSRKVK